MVNLHDLADCRFVTELGHLAGKRVVKHIRETFVENQREDKVLELRSVGRATDGAGRVPQPCFERGDVQVLFSGWSEWKCGKFKRCFQCLMASGSSVNQC